MKKKRTEAIIFLILALFSTAIIHLYVVFYTGASSDHGDKTVTVLKGANLRAVAEGLEKEGIIRDSNGFVLVARVIGAYKTIKAGEYEFRPSMSPMEIIDILVKGRVKSYTVVVPEGFNIDEIAAALKATGLIKETGGFALRAKDRRLAGSLGFDSSSLEGYLFPDTYTFTGGMTPDEIIFKMVERFKTVYSKEFEGLARKRGMPMKKVITLASIIEKETGAPEERPLISSVFHNRLRKRIKLQSDPTVVYAIKDFSGNITKRDLLAKTPYNTYVVYGLPPGPIANPGRASIMAALIPAKGDYLYFVSKNNGTHHFSRNLREHNNAVNRYQRKKGRRGSV